MTSDYKNIDEINIKGYSKTKILSKEECLEIADELENLRIIRNSNDTSWGEYEIYPHPHKTSELILKLFGHPIIVDIVENILGDKIDGFQSFSYFKPPGELGRDIHQDSFYVRSEWGKSVNLVIFIDDMDIENGCLFSYEYSHFLPILPIEIDEERTKTNPQNFKNERGKACIMPEGHRFPKVYHTGEIGDVLFLHDHLVHGSEQNKSDKFRKSLVLSYKSKKGTIREGQQMKREPFDVYEIRQKYWGV